ncbi:MAG: hypothetical protein NUV92_10525 [Ignavibacteria bacterium]|jgi:hypothetical protein|nr:hypothetical protein [Ignavibacteria bacterium]MDH7527237.1 hypothetical protein [Ignavibacteria bacterium]
MINSENPIKIIRPKEDLGRYDFDSFIFKDFGIKGLEKFETFFIHALILKKPILTIDVLEKNINSIVYALAHTFNLSYIIYEDYIQKWWPTLQDDQLFEANERKVIEALLSHDLVCFKNASKYEKFIMKFLKTYNEMSDKFKDTNKLIWFNSPSVIKNPFINDYIYFFIKPPEITVDECESLLDCLKRYPKHLNYLIEYIRIMNKGYNDIDPELQNLCEKAGEIIVREVSNFLPYEQAIDEFTKQKLIDLTKLLFFTSNRFDLQGIYYIIYHALTFEQRKQIQKASDFGDRFSKVENELKSLVEKHEIKLYASEVYYERQFVKKFNLLSYWYSRDYLLNDYIKLFIEKTEELRIRDLKPNSQSIYYPKDYNLNELELYVVNLIFLIYIFPLIIRDVLPTEQNLLIQVAKILVRFYDVETNRLGAHHSRYTDLVNKEIVNDFIVSHLLGIILCFFNRDLGIPIFEFVYGEVKGLFKYFNSNELLKTKFKEEICTI